MTLEIELEELSATYHALDLTFGDSDELGFALDRPQGWARLNDVLKLLEKQNES